MAALLILLHCWLQDVYSANSTVFIARQHTVWCILYGVYFGCLLYADGIMLLSHSLSAMRCMLQICDDFATEYDIIFNTNKSVAMRIGVRYNAVCEPLSCNKLMFFFNR